MEVGAQKDGGGPNVFMREALNLIDFFDENYKITDTAIDNNDDDGSIDINAMDTTTPTTPLTTTIDGSESSIISTNVEQSSITASGIVPEADLAGMYKHYLITRLAERDDELRQRYADVDLKFAKILGISTDSQVRIKQSLAYSAYKGMLINVLQYKGVVEPQDISQFVVLKDSLNLSKDIADKVYDEATRGAIVEHAAKLFRDNENGLSFTPEIAKTFREQVGVLHYTTL